MPGRNRVSTNTTDFENIELPPEPRTKLMTTSGILVMLVSVSTVTVLFGWCIYKVLTTPHEAEKVHGVEFHTPDMTEDK
jgi:hypothetical protein